MSKGIKKPRRRADYKAALRALQIELVKVQRYVIIAVGTTALASNA